MRGSTSIAALLATLGMTVGAIGAEVPLVDMPTPCPCAADGVCYPKRDTWGHYAPRWRKWPYDHRANIPGRVLETAPGALPDSVSPIEAPPKEDEDRRAPLSTREREGRDVPSAGEGGVGSPPIGDLPVAPRPEPGLPGGRPGPGAQPAQPDGGFEFDPPPAVPFGDPPAGGFEFGGEEEEGGFQFPYQSPNSGLRFDSDLPPALPRGLAPQQGSAGLARDAGSSSPGQMPRGTVSPLPYVSRQTAGAKQPTLVAPASAESPVNLPSQRVGRAVFLMPAEIAK